MVAFSFDPGDVENATGERRGLSDEMKQANDSGKDGMNMSHMGGVFLFLSIVSIALFSFIAVAVWSKERRLEREAYYKSETVRKIAETQAGGGSVAIEYLRESEKIAARSRREGQKLGGLITVAIGISLMIFIGVADRQSVDRGYLLGLIPLFIGLALLAYAYLLAPKG